MRRGDRGQGRDGKERGRSRLEEGELRRSPRRRRSPARFARPASPPRQRLGVSAAEVKERERVKKAEEEAKREEEEKARKELEEEERLYQERVEQQMRELEEQQKREEEADEFLRERRKRRRKLLAEYGGSEDVEMQEAEPPAEPPQPEGAVLLKSLTSVIVPSEIEEKSAKIEAEEDDGFDMFSDKPIELVAPAAVSAAVAVKGADGTLGLQDNYDDPEGYYSFRLGDILDNGRYEVFANQGKGVFSSVLRVRDLQAGNRELVIKVIRNNPVMYKAGLKELNFLRLLSSQDPENKRHIVRLFSHFEHRGHLCLVFEPMYMNLRQLLKKYGGVGISLDGVRSYAKQLFTALKFLKRNDVVHADLKPDNLIVNDKLNLLKLCDFGSAGMTNECEITPYLVSRYYRAPEIILGLPYSCAIDMWSAACVLFELYTGQILFQGENNNGMLHAIMSVKGRFNAKLLRKAEFAKNHFDSDFVFERRTRDAVTGEVRKKSMKFLHSGKDLLQMLRQSSGKLTEEESKKLRLLKDLIEKCLALDPSIRLTPELALKHPFLT